MRWSLIRLPSRTNCFPRGAFVTHAQAYSISLSGTLEGTGTRWRATYRWQPEATVDRRAPFAENTPQPYLNLQFRQPIHLRRDGTGGFEALLDLRNLLAQGYRPYLLNDGSLLVFAQDQRGGQRRSRFQFLAPLPAFIFDPLREFEILRAVMRLDGASHPLESAPAVLYFSSGSRNFLLLRPCAMTPAARLFRLLDA